MRRPRYPIMHLVLLALVVGLFLLTAVPRHDAWIRLDGGAPGQAPTVRVLEQDVRSVVVEVRLPGCTVERIDLDGVAHSRVTLPGCPPALEAGYPELPLLARTLAVAGEGTPRLEILAHDEQPLAARPPVPSRGPLSRDRDPALVKHVRGPVYASQQVWPPQVATLGEPFLLHGQRGVALRTAPVRWDAGRGRLLATRRLVVRITTTGGGGKNALAGDKAGAGPDSPVFRTVYDRVFLNAPAVADKSGEEPPAPRMLMICGDALAGAAQELAQWKRQRGVEVEVVTMAQLGGSVLGMRQAIYNRYREPAGLTYLLLVGDVEQVPTMQGLFQGADSDGMFALIQGNDLYADLLVSRLPARTPDEVRQQAARLLAIERDAQPGDAWYDRAVGIASDEGDPPDHDRADWLREDLLGYGFSDVARVYQLDGATTADVAAAVEAGVSLINYLGHGSGTAWLSVPFGNADVHALTNTGHWPWIIDVSCDNGDFSRPECLAEAWLRAGTPAAPTGAAGVVAASTIAPWVPPCVMQAEMVDRLVSEDTRELGALFLAGIARVLEVYDGFTVAQQVMEQYNLLGDTSLEVRTRAPQALAVVHDPVVPAAPGPWTVSVSGADQAVATLTRAGALLAHGRSGADGQAELTWFSTAAPVPGEMLTLTVTAFNAVPYVGTVTVEESVTGQPDFPPLRSALLGNFPNPCNPTTTIRFELSRPGAVRLSLYDARGRLVRNLLQETRPAGTHEVVWDGNDDTGRPAASGVYQARLVTGTTADTRPLALVR